MSISSIGGTAQYGTANWSPTTRGSDSTATYDRVAAVVVASPAVPSAFDKSWVTRNLSAQGKATITATTGVAFGAAGSVLVPISASPNDSYTLHKTLHLLNSHRGGFAKYLTSEQVLQLVEQNAPGGNPEPLQNLIRRTADDGRPYA